MRLALVPAETRLATERTSARVGDAGRAVAQAQSPGTSAVVLDRKARMPGRGAYLCRDEREGLPRESCFALAKRSGGVGRTLRSPAKIDWSDLVESISR